ncbi:MAG: DUF423 domain-containing protein [Alphaproteobacteria bacterium]|nr:DUF423 domain-containing protein [Alphaproteobacteria bacterium]
MTRTSVLLALAGVFGASAVALGAWAAHGLEASFGPRATSLVETGVRYQLWHALAMVGALALYRTARGHEAPGQTQWLARAAQLFAAGIILFCGALYLLAFGAPRWMGAVAPIGGLALIVGWLVLAWGGIHAFGHDQSGG